MNKKSIKNLLQDSFPKKQPLGKKKFRDELKKMASLGLIKFGEEHENCNVNCYGHH